MHTNYEIEGKVKQQYILVILETESNNTVLYQGTINIRTCDHHNHCADQKLTSRGCSGPKRSLKLTPPH